MMNSWRELLLQAVSPLESGIRSLTVNGHRPAGEEGSRPGRTAAVLVPLLDSDEPALVLTRRADHLPTHPGQVSFPGGAAEEQDDSAVETALREANEEIGLPGELATPIGFLDRMDTISDYRVLPVVALVKPPIQWQLDEREVAEVFTVPLSVLLSEESFSGHRVERDGSKFTVWSMQYEGFHIWGVTASIILNLAQRMRAIHVSKNPG